MTRLSLYGNPKLLAIAMLGIVSGFPLALVGQTFTAWLSESGVSKTDIGLFALISTPYALKFAWAPLVDILRVPYFSRKFGRRRGWLFITQIALGCALVTIAQFDPKSSIIICASLLLLIAFLSATQDIIIDAYRVEVLHKREQAAGAASAVSGYMVGMKILGGAGALLIADAYSWRVAYSVMGLCVIPGMLAALAAGEPDAHSVGEGNMDGAASNQSLIARMRHMVLNPFIDFFSRPGWLMLLLFVLLYKLTDAFAGTMMMPFLLDTGFSKTDIGYYLKIYGLFATLIGSFIGGVMAYRMPLAWVLLVGGLLQMLSNLVFIWQARHGVDPVMFAYGDVSFAVPSIAISVAVENASGGLGTAAFVAFVSRLCHHEYTATQYALLSSLAAVGRTWLSAFSGLTVDFYGWNSFFALSCILAVPSLLLLPYVHKYFRQVRD